MTKNSEKIRDLLNSIAGLRKERDAIDRRIAELQIMVSDLVASDSD